MRPLPLITGLLVGLATLPACGKGMDEKQVRRIAREEIRQELDARERARGMAPHGPEALTPPDKARPLPRRKPDTPDRAAERLHRRIATLEKLLARFKKLPNVKPERIALMEKQLAKMRRRLATLKRKQ